MLLMADFYIHEHVFVVYILFNWNKCDNVKPVYMSSQNQSKDFKIPHNCILFKHDIISDAFLTIYIILMTGSFEFTGVQNSYSTIDNSGGGLTVDSSWTYMTWHKNLGTPGFLFVFYPSSSSCSHGMVFMWVNTKKNNYRIKYKTK